MILIPCMSVVYQFAGMTSNRRQLICLFSLSVHTQNKPQKAKHRFCAPTIWQLRWKTSLGVSLWKWSNVRFDHKTICNKLRSSQMSPKLFRICVSEARLHIEPDVDGDCGVKRNLITIRWCWNLDYRVRLYQTYFKGFPNSTSRCARGKHSAELRSILVWLGKIAKNLHLHHR